ncbi:MAG: hypothetical protein OXJ54_10230 [Gemmatimonadetes bacterium]|nr:hypothetical protein [Candidatus Palauibacter rhopaloidicola]
MGVLTIRNVDDDVIAALKRQAEANHRSLEGELRHLLARHAVPNTVPAVADSRTGCGAWLGAMSDVGEIVGDIRSPAADPSEWAALRPAAADPSDGSDIARHKDAMLAEAFSDQRE